MGAHSGKINNSNPTYVVETLSVNEDDTKNVKFIKQFDDFDKYLTSDFSDDYWSDEGIGFAVEKLSAFTREDWSRLKNESNNRSVEWVIRCAETLGDVEDYHIARYFDGNTRHCK